MSRSQKVIVCACEDVTMHDLQVAAGMGIRDLEELKRYTGFGTGPCQGKACMLQVAQFLAAERAADGGDEHGPAVGLAPFTSRPPVCGVPLKLFASDAKRPNDR